MRTNKFFLTGFLIFTMSWLFPLTLHAQNQSDPVGLLQYIADNMISQLKEHKATLKTDRELVYKLAYEYVVPYADLDEMSKRVLPRQTWNQASASQRERFKDQFTKLLIRTYTTALTSYRDQTVKFYPVRGGAGGTVQVSSDIVSPESQPIHVTYRLLRTGSGWRLYDMSVEGVSMLESFRSQFADILAHGNIEELINRMSSHNMRRG